MPFTALRALVAAALTLPVLAIASPVDAAPVARRDDGSQVRVGTFNIIYKSSVASFSASLEALKPSVDVLGLQEIGLTDKNKLMIRNLAWGYYRPPQYQQNPVIWRRDVLDFVSGAGVRLSKGGPVEPSVGGRGENAKDDNYATVVRLFHRPTGQQLSFVNVHLLSGTVEDGRPIKSRPKAVAMYRTQLASLVALVKKEQANPANDAVYALGDFNAGFEMDQRRRLKQMPFRSFKAAGYRSMWTKSPYLSKKYGTVGRALIDQVWAKALPISAQIPNVKGSDHRPAVATYDLPAPAPGYVAPTGTVGFGATPAPRNEYTAVAGKYVEFPMIGDFSHGYYTVRVVPGGTAEEGPVEGKTGDFYIDPISFVPGSRTIYVKINKDGKDEPEETFTLEIVNPVNMTPLAGHESVTYTILANSS